MNSIHYTVQPRCFRVSNSMYCEVISPFMIECDVPQTVTCSIVAARLDYCNAMPCGAPATTLDKLQRAHNNLVRVKCQCRGRTAVPIAQLASVEAAGHLQGGSTDSQGADYSHSVVSHDLALRSPDTPLLHALFLLQPHPCRTIYWLTLDCARAFPYSSATRR